MPVHQHACDGPTFKDVVVIGNGPSAITLSYMLAGNTPFYSGNTNDEFLHLRLTENADEPLVLQDLAFLSDGLEGRSTNPVSILFDALSHPDADLGDDKPSLLNWQYRQDLKVDHVVLGKGCPGGAWKMMKDSDLLTVSLGTWMELPNLSLKDWNPKKVTSVGKRVNVSTVAKYYQEYVKLMSLGSNFEEDTLVTSVRKISNCGGKKDHTTSITTTVENCEGIGLDVIEGNAVFQQESLYNEQNEALATSSQSTSEDLDCSSSGTGATSSVSSSEVTDTSSDDMNEIDMMPDSSLSSTRFGQMMKYQARRRANTTCCLDLVSKCGGKVVENEEMKFDLSWNPIVFGCDSDPMGGGSYCHFGSSGGRSYSWSTSRCRPRRCKPIRGCPMTEMTDQSDLYEVSGTKTLPNGTITPFQYLTKNIVLATGSYDQPNSLDIPGENLDCVVHSLQDMEQRINSGDLSDDPIMIVGAGLSAADAIIAALNKGLSVVHVFRRSANDRRLIFNNLPAAIYPEYHEIHRMMAKKQSRRGYQPYGQHHVVKIEANNEVLLHGTNNTSHLETLTVSLCVVLIGSSPNLKFLEDEGRDLGIIPEETISRNNLIDIDLFSHECIRQPGIYAMGPLVGDNFVRFLQGGALAISNHILKKKYQKDI